MAWHWRQKSTVQTVPLPAEGLEQRTQQLGRELLAEARGTHAGVLSKKFWSDQLMAWAMQDQTFKIALFQFIDVFPALKTPDQIHDHLEQYLLQPGVTLPPGLATALKAGGLLKGTLARTITSQVEGMAEKFIAGRTAEEAAPKLLQLWQENVAFSVDLLGEACVSAAESAAYRQRYIDLIQTLGPLTARWPPHAQLERDHLGPIPRVNVSVKISAFDPRIRVADFEGTIARLLAALKPLLEAAAKNDMFINFDMEQFEFKDLTIALFQRCCEVVDFPAGLAMQAYLRSGENDLAEMIHWAQRRQKQVTIRLIKGAYWDYETIHADMLNWPAPVWRHKRETDANFERMAQTLIQQTPRRPDQPGLKAALGTHNARSIAWAMACAEEAGLPQNAIEFQALRGMADELKHVLVQRGWRLREYVPMGEMLPGMAYLVRRLLENTSNESWLRAGFVEDADVGTLLESPHNPPVQTLAGAPSADEPVELANEPWRDFADQPTRQHFAAEVQAAKVPAVRDCTLPEAGHAIEKAAAAFAAWRAVPVQERAQRLLNVCTDLKAHRDTLAAVIVKETAKPWAEADADVCEAIDFCDFYARAAVALQTPHKLTSFPGELNEQWFEPRGVAVVISPWNFPLAICLGMTAAALVTGNTVIVKPAEQSVVTAQLMCDFLWGKAKIPQDVLHFVPGPGEAIGAALVRDPRVAIIAFTGSKAVGLNIVEAAGKTLPGQRTIKRAIAEMGGKNAIIVDSSADLDEAVLGVRQSAFGYAGQKCSACSRAIVLEDIYETFTARLVEATKALTIGDASLPATDVGPVIDDHAAASIRRYIEIAKAQATLALAMTTEARAGGKPLIGPVIFTDVPPDSVLAREEIFGPVLSVLKAATFADALALANASEYKLTGGVFSRSPRHLELARREFRVGNLYLNRGITGALVGRQPFGGFGMSGLGSKAGGREYLLHFVDPRVVTTNTLRRGFAAEVKP